tara:strand:- start:3 stop:1199 length:1197 start_codon:yes stop_codon:yes gene_type:complete
MNVLSLFDGMSCGRIALDRLNIPVTSYYAAEIDKYATQVSEANYPDIIRLGDVCGVKAEDLEPIDLLIAGSPCQGFSFAGKQLAFDDPRSALFFEFVRLLKECKPKYFLLENVRMKKEFLDIISEQVGCEPIMINSALVSAQNRVRFYWTNIPGIEQPEQRGIVLRDILETREVEGLTDKAIAYMNRSSDKWSGGKTRKDIYIKDESEKSMCLTANMYKGVPYGVVAVDKPIQVGVAVDINGHDVLKRFYSPDGKSPTVNTCQGGNREPKVITGGAIRGRAYDKEGKRMDKDGISVANKTTQMLELRKDDKSNAITTVGKDSLVVENEVYWRKLTCIECERLQTVPDDYTACVSNTQRYKMLGNGWNIETICHIFKNMQILEEGGSVKHKTGQLTLDF